MLTLIGLELKKLFSRGIAYIGIGAIVLMVLAIQIGMSFEGKNLLDFLINNLSDVFLLEGELINIYTVSYIILNTLWIDIPILVAIVAGDIVSGETNRGTFRLLLTRPVSRTKLITAKFITAQIYTLLLVLLLITMSLVVGRLFLSSGDMVVFTNAINIFPEDTVLYRFLGAFAYGIVSMWVVSSLAFLFSTRFSNSLIPIITTMSVILLLTIISNFSVGVFKPIRPFLFTTHMSGWQYFFQDPIKYDRIINSILILGSHIILFYGASIILFKNKDITS